MKQRKGRNAHEWWTQRDGTRRKIELMNDTHLSNTINLLVRGRVEERAKKLAMYVRQLKEMQRERTRRDKAAKAGVKVSAAVAKARDYPSTPAPAVGLPYRGTRPATNGVLGNGYDKYYGGQSKY